MKKKIVSFLVSGRGSNFQAVAADIISGNIQALPGVVISNNPDAGALSIADQMGIPRHCVKPSDYSSIREYESAMIHLLEDAGTDLVVCAGFLRILSTFFIARFQDRIINIHPALLPSFPGLHSQKKALEYGVRISGCTTHFIDEGTDTGPIILQACVHVTGDDTEASLSRKILKEEHVILGQSVKLFCEGKLRVSGRKVIIDD